MENIFYAKKRLTKNGVMVKKGTPIVVIEKENALDCEIEEMKLKFSITKKEMSTELMNGPGTLNEDDVYVMMFNSGERDYFSIGKDIKIMAKNILSDYNSFCMDKTTIKAMSNEEDYNFFVYRVPTNKAFNMERYLPDEFYVGNYLDKYRPKNKKWNYNEKRDFLLKWCV